MVADKAVCSAMAKIPFGGFRKGAAKSKAKGAWAIVAIGGWEYIKDNSTLSFNRLDGYSIYLHSEYDGLPGYEQALAAATAIYPNLKNLISDILTRLVRRLVKKLGNRVITCFLNPIT